MEFRHVTDHGYPTQTWYKKKNKKDTTHLRLLSGIQTYNQSLIPSPIQTWFQRLKTSAHFEETEDKIPTIF